MSALRELLRRHPAFEPVLGDLQEIAAPLVLDLSADNRDLAGVDLTDTPAFAAWVEDRMAAASVPMAVGRYGEDRVVYRHSPLFDGEVQRRSIHLGMDLFAARDTAVHAPLDAVVHSTGDNCQVGDYGPTVVLEHELGGQRFWTLYGHLRRQDLPGLASGRRIPAGQAFAGLGNLHENGGWPPHLHFQVIAEIGDSRGDYPGVAAPSDREAWLARCPDPNLILRLPIP